VEEFDFVVCGVFDSEYKNSVVYGLTQFWEIVILDFTQHMNFVLG
jgi:hypothetical protein